MKVYVIQEDNSYPHVFLSRSAADTYVEQMTIQGKSCRSICSELSYGVSPEVLTYVIATAIFKDGEIYGGIHRTPSATKQNPMIVEDCISNTPGCTAVSVWLSTGDYRTYDEFAEDAKRICKEIYRKQVKSNGISTEN